MMTGQRTYYYIILMSYLHSKRGDLCAQHLLRRNARGNLQYSGLLQKHLQGQLDYRPNGLRDDRGRGSFEGRRPAGDRKPCARHDYAIAALRGRQDAAADRQ